MQRKSRANVLFDPDPTLIHYRDIHRKLRTNILPVLELSYGSIGQVVDNVHEASLNSAPAHESIECLVCHAASTGSQLSVNSVPIVAIPDFPQGLR